MSGMISSQDRGSPEVPAVRQSSVPAMKDPIRDLDFSRAAQNRMVRKATWLGSLTSYPLILGIMSGGAAIILEPAFFLISVMIGIGGTVIGLGNAFYTSQYRANRIKQYYLQSLKEEIARQKEERLKNLEQELECCGSHISGCQRVSRQGHAQFLKGKEKLENILDLLNKRLNPYELTALEFEGNVVQVYACLLDNLRTMVILLQSVSTIDKEEIKRRLNELEHMTHRSSLDDREIRTLQEQLELREQKFAEVADLLIENEEALTGLDQTATTIADLDTGRREARTTMEEARQDLMDFVQRTAVRLHSPKISSVRHVESSLSSN